MTTPDFNYHGDVVVFDLDDTLMRERDFCRSGFRWIARRLTEQLGRPMHGVAMRMESRLRKRQSHFDLLEEILEPYAADRDSLRQIMEATVAGYRAHRPDRLPFAPGAEEALAGLSRRGIAMAIVTDGRSVTQRAKIEALGLGRYIPEHNIYISEECGADKQAPDSFRSIVRGYPEARRFIYVADNPRKDFRMPNMMGWLTCQVEWTPDNVHPATAPSDPADAPAIEIRTPADLLTLCDGATV